MALSGTMWPGPGRVVPEPAGSPGRRGIDSIETLAEVPKL